MLPANRHHEIILSFEFLHVLWLIVPCEQRLHFRCVSCVRKRAFADNRSIFYCACAKFVARFASIVRFPAKWREFRGNKNKIAKTLICYVRLTQCSKPVKSKKKTRSLIYSSRFLDCFEMVVGRGYFSHASSDSENVASARRVGSLRSCMSNTPLSVSSDE